jgi:hypothetical protein
MTARGNSLRCSRNPGSNLNAGLILAVLLPWGTPLLQLHCGTREMRHISKLVLGRHRTQKLMRPIDVQWKLRERLARSPC